MCGGAAVASGATVVVCPPALLGQWQSKVARHAEPGALRIITARFYAAQVVPRIEAARRSAIRKRTWLIVSSGKPDAVRGPGRQLQRLYLLPLRWPSEAERYLSPSPKSTSFLQPTWRSQTASTIVKAPSPASRLRALLSDFRLSARAAVPPTAAAAPESS